MKTFRIITAIVLIVGLIGVFSAFSAEQTKQGKKEGIITDTPQSKDQKKGPATTMQAPAANLQSLPLTITRLYLKDGKVHVVIKKQGSERLSDEDYASTKLKVEASTLKKPLEWTLLEVDPRKHLNRFRREKDFNTGLAVTARVQVTATLYRGLWKTAKEETLAPAMAKVDVKTRMAAPAQKRDVVLPSEPVHLLDDWGGIRITSPDDEDVIDLSRDSTEPPINVVYSFTSPVPSGNITFTLEQIGLPAVAPPAFAEKTIWYRPPDDRLVGSDPPKSFSFRWNLHEDFRWDLPGRDGFYYIKARHENGAFGTSDTFTIDCPGEGGFHGGADLELVYPTRRGGEYFRDICGAIPVRFRIVGNYEAVPTRWLIWIYQIRDEEDRLVTDYGSRARLERELECEDYEDVDAGSVPYRECSVLFSLRNEAFACPLPCGTYKLAIQNVEWRSFMSDGTAGGFGLGICDAWIPIIITVERSLRAAYGEDIKIGDNINYNWAPRVFEATVHLMKGEEGEEEIIDTNEGCGDGPADSCGGSFPTDSLEEGDDYKVRVINPANPDNWVDSRTFTVRP
jgi:hypothetical protein